MHVVSGGAICCKRHFFFFFFVSLSSHQNSRSRCKISMICTFLVFFIFNFYFLLFYKIIIYFQSLSLILIYDMLFFFNLI